MSASADLERKPLYTIGHSNRSLDDFLDLLREHEIELLIDVRRFPASRRHPHFNASRLAEATEQIGIGYHPMKSLGGRRGKPDPAGLNDYWRVDGFRSYADYMGTEEGKKAMNELKLLTAGKRAAVMCAEAVPWQCHRRLIADIMASEGYEVVNITGPGASHLHEPSPALKQKEDGTYIWPGEGTQGKLEF